MSTKSKHRAKKVIFIMLGVSSIATLGLVASHHFDDQANNDFTEPNNDVDHSLNSNYVNDGSEAVTSQEVTNLKENSKGEDNLPPPDSKESKNKVVASMIPNIEKYQKVSVIATGYTAGIESTGKTPSHPEYGITYSGVKVRRDTYSTIAADIHIFPLGTILYIPGYGYGVVADIGSAIKGNKIDLYYETVDEVYKEWGKKQVEVYLIKLGNGRVTESLLDQYNNKTEVTLNTEM